jgi:hypothetical protein
MRSSESKEGGVPRILFVAFVLAWAGFIAAMTAVSYHHH